jgi:hypothetical protein
MVKGIGKCLLAHMFVEDAALIPEHTKGESPDSSLAPAENQNAGPDSALAVSSNYE